MATENNNKKRKNHYRPNNKSVKKGPYPLRPGVQGFFITCDGGRERQASHEAVQLIESFLEELAEGKEPDVKHTVKPMNKKIKFSYSSSDSETDDDVNGEKEQDKSESQPKDGQEDVKNEEESQPEKKQKCAETNVSNNEQLVKPKSIDQLIEAELDELKDKTKRRFNYLDTGCNGVVFVQMKKRGEKDPTPKELAQRIITSAAATK
ncbi:uncharacterized protein LOC143559583 [Bidens hawaiensis]|uniref:uncharacterized protein LOC143559583 n=1 Tax=Bidens hawaiensis TaxID=980011 RepID=UPI00404AEFFC